MSSSTHSAKDVGVARQRLGRQTVGTPSDEFLRRLLEVHGRPGRDLVAKEL